MSFRRTHRMPDRLVALSVSLPPRAHERPRPFGFGTLVFTQRPYGEAEFETHSRGFAARYDPGRMKDELNRLFDPDTIALIYLRTGSHVRMSELRRTRFSADQLHWIPKVGQHTNLCVRGPRHLLTNAAGIAGIDLPEAAPSALGRLRQMDDEAQAAWLLWLMSAGAPRLRRPLLASFMAWNRIERARCPSD